MIRSLLMVGFIMWVRLNEVELRVMVFEVLFVEIMLEMNVCCVGVLKVFMMLKLSVKLNIIGRVIRLLSRSMFIVMVSVSSVDWVVNRMCCWLKWLVIYLVRFISMSGGLNCSVMVMFMVVVLLLVSLVSII